MWHSWIISAVPDSLNIHDQNEFEEPTTEADTEAMAEEIKQLCCYTRAAF